MASQKDNYNPVVYESSPLLQREDDYSSYFEIENSETTTSRDVIDNIEVFELIRHLNDPEHPLTLEQLKVVYLDGITVNDEKNTIKVLFTPTIPHCSMATLIGLSIRVKLLRSLPSRFKVSIGITPGSHVSEAAISKQLNDKERVAAALENSHLTTVVNQSISGSDR